MEPLHITNGDVAAELIRASRVGGEVVAWRDVLHEGPVPAGLSLDELSRLRAAFLADCPRGPELDRVIADFERRNSALRAYDRYPEVVMWFEHDLYDQLQLLQILDWFATRDRGSVRLSLICIGDHPRVERFLGLGQLTPAQMEERFERRSEIDEERLRLGRRGWHAFRLDTPRGLERLLEEDLSDLEFLEPALLRHLEQFPAVSNGLSRSERQILETAADGVRRLSALFKTSQIDREQRPFVGDWTFLLYLGPLCDGPAPLLTFADRRPFITAALAANSSELWDCDVDLTDAGRRVLEGQADRVSLLGIDRWLGGVHLHGRHGCWRRRDSDGALVEGPPV